MEKYTAEDKLQVARLLTLRDTAAEFLLSMARLPLSLQAKTIKAVHKNLF